jgi:hypothetical protein
MDHLVIHSQLLADNDRTVIAWGRESRWNIQMLFGPKVNRHRRRIRIVLAKYSQFKAHNLENFVCESLLSHHCASLANLMTGQQEEATKAVRLDSSSEPSAWL